MKKQLIYAATIGGCVGALLTMAFGLVVPLGAQDEPSDATFGKITCTELEVADSNGLRGVGIVLGTSERGGYVHVYNNERSRVAWLDNNEHGGIVAATGNGNGAAALGMVEEGAIVSVINESNLAEMSVNASGSKFRLIGNNPRSTVFLLTDEYGGHVTVFDKDDMRCAMRVNENGDGVMNTWDKNGNRTWP